MKSKKATQRALLSSVLSLLLCCSMLLGTTFAWFTDSVTSTGNIIKSGTLDVEMKWADGTKAVPAADSNEWTDASTSAIFKHDKWEPGYTEVRHIKISNVGTLALKYQLNIIANGVVSDLSDAIDVYFADGGAQAADRTALNDSTKFTNVGTLTQILAGMPSNASGDLKETESDIVTIALKMREEAGNEYQNLSVGSSFSVKLYATQLEAEKDSFDEQYDKFADYDGEISSAEGLAVALKAGGTYKVTNDIELTEAVEIPEGVTVALDLNGKTITGTVGRDADGNRVHTLINYGTLTAANGTVASAGDNGGSAVYNKAGAVLTLEDVTVLGAPKADGSWPSYGINNYGTMTVNGAVVKTYHGGIATGGNGVTTINDADVDVGQNTATGITSYTLYTEGDAKLTVNGGTYANTASDAKSTGGAIACEGGDNAIEIKGGSFSGGCGLYGSYVITGGTFDRDVKDHVASGYKTVQTSGGYVVVSDSVDAVASTSAELTTALTEAAAANAGDSTIVLTGDIDMTNTTWTPIKVDGYNGAGVVTIEGNGAAITGLTAPLFEGGFAGQSGIVIKNLTIADSTIVSTSGLGGGAFVDSADSMQVITLENCHLVNSAVSGERAGGLIGWCTGYAKQDDGPVKAYVTISKCSVVDSTVTGAGSAGGIAGHPGASDYTYTTIENCAVKNVKVISDDDGSWRTGAVVGTANNGHVEINNVTVENVTLTQNGVTAAETKLYGRFVPAGTGTLVIDGVPVVADTASLNTAVSGGATSVVLADGKYKMSEFSSLQSKTLTLVGSENAVIDATAITVNNQFVTNANLVFEGITINFASDNYYGLANTASLTYKDCVINGYQYLYGKSITFEGCTLNSTGYTLCAYAAENVTVDGCVFNTAGKAVLLYKDNLADDSYNVTVKGTTFNATEAGYAGAITNQPCAAIEIHNYGASYNLITSGNTIDSDFSGEWRIKTFESNGTTVTVNGVAYTQTAVDGKLFTVTNQEATYN